MRPANSVLAARRGPNCSARAAVHSGRGAASSNGARLSLRTLTIQKRLCLTAWMPNSVCHNLPCSILDDVGGAFGMGAVGGGLWHLLKGMKNSPTGHRFVGGIDVSPLHLCHMS